MRSARPQTISVTEAHGGLSEFNVVAIINHVPYAQSLQLSHRSCTYVTHP